MESATGGTDSGASGPATPVESPTVTVRYWAAARAAAGRREDMLRGSSVAEVLDAVRREHAANGSLLRILQISSLLLGDRPLGSSDLGSVKVANGDVIDVLPPFAGG